MKKMIRILILLTSTVLIVTSLVGCKKTEDMVLEQPNLYTVVIYADFTNGDISTEGEELIKEDVFEMEIEPKIEDLASALKQWTGLDFTLKSSKIEGKAAYVDWATNSTLVGGLDDRKQLEEFYFYDSTSLNWFMMDSLASTIKANFLVDKIFYSQGGGKPISFQDGQGIGLNELPLEQSYEGSVFFVSQSGEM